jgi:Uma2 family endonuclease
MVVGEKLYTADEFWREFGGKTGVELVKGVPTDRMSPTGTAHMIIAAWLIHLLYTYVDEHDLGIVTASEGGFLLATDPDTVRAPDAGFIAKTRLIEPTPERFFPGPPDLAVEVVSPNDSASDIRDKVLEFLRAGTRQVWVIYPRSRTIDIFKPVAEPRLLNADDTLDGGDVLAGFSVPVREVFKKLRE